MAHCNRTNERDELGVDRLADELPEVRPKIVCSSSVEAHFYAPPLPGTTRSPYHHPHQHHRDSTVSQVPHISHILVGSTMRFPRSARSSNTPSGIRTALLTGVFRAGGGHRGGHAADTSGQGRTVAIQSVDRHGVGSSAYSRRALGPDAPPPRCDIVWLACSARTSWY